MSTLIYILFFLQKETPYALKTSQFNSDGTGRHTKYNSAYVGSNIFLVDDSVFTREVLYQWWNTWLMKHSKTGYCEKKFTNINIHVNVLIMLQNKSKSTGKTAFIHSCFAIVTRNWISHSQNRCIWWFLFYNCYVVWK